MDIKRSFVKKHNSAFASYKNDPSKVHKKALENRN